MKTLTKTLTILLMLLLAVSCSKDEGLLSTGDELSDVLKKAEMIPDLCLEGPTYFDFFVRTDKIPMGMAGYCTAQLWYDEIEETYKLQTMEYRPDETGNLVLYREVEFDLKITPGGQVMFPWPPIWTEEGEELGADGFSVVDLVKLHTGATDLFGPGINKNTLIYKGHFNGSKLEVMSHFTGMDALGLEGPVGIKFSYDLEVVGCPTP
jgi:hypothetical protein